ncbi:MAG: dTDP-4-dehydrorhamnose 3,5-epimerase [Actinomycetaceae bacterium]|nr:dTDP-4-dehydrorhamnose 3,5-epimerase [Actinomycetaceae bacterium]
MEYRELSVPGAWEITPKQFPDPRGVFTEVFKAPVFAQHMGHALNLAQVNCSVSKAGVVRGIHFAQVPPSQAKYVMCPSGAVLDFAIDIREGSPTFGTWDSVLLDDVTRRAIYLSEGLGHCFVSLKDNSTVMYLCSEGYNPGREFGINPTCPEVALTWPDKDVDGNPLEVLLSDKDTAAPGLSEALSQGILPTWNDCQAFAQDLRASFGQA